jgi:hypothetical protein
MKGVASNFNAGGLTDLTKKLEMNAKNGDLSNGKYLVEKIDLEVAAIKRIFDLLNAQELP